MICPLLRGRAPFAFLLTALLLPSAAVRAQAPQGRILNTFDSTLRSFEPFLETETMIVSAQTETITEWNGQQRIEWRKVKFWNKDGSNYSERLIPAGRETGGPWRRCIAHGNDLFLPSGGSFYVVNRNPAIPIDWMGYHEDTLCSVGDRFAVVRIPIAQDWDGIKFFDRQTLQQVGRVATTLRVQQLVQRDNDIVFVSRDPRGNFRFHRMDYPDFTKSDVVKMKITNLPGAYGWVVFFGKDYAVTSIGEKEYIIRYSDPAKNGKPGIYLVQEPYYSADWVECNGKLARWQMEGPTLSTVEFGNGSYTLKPVGLPPGFNGSNYISAGENSIYITDAASGPSFGDRNWVQRLSFSPGRQLSLNSPVADERDGVLRFTARLDQAATQPVTFSYETAGGSAISGTDFTATSGSASIPAGQREAHIDIPLTEDFTIEGPESLELRITSLQGAFCDNATSNGRIRGSGARPVEEVANDSGGTVTGTLDATTSRADAKRQFTIGAKTLDARQLGFEAFWPVADGGDGFRYARALPLGGKTMKFCQFNGSTGELLEVFDHAPFKAEAGKLILGKGAGYTRYGFFDGLPVLSLAGVPVPEGPAPKEFAVRSERTHAEFAFTAAWDDPLSTLGTPSFAQQPSGDIVFRISGGQEQPQSYDFTANLRTTVDSSGNPSRTMLTPVQITEDNTAAMTFVPGLTLHGESLAATGNRVWKGDEGGTILESFVFQGGTLSAGTKLNLPVGTKIRPDISTRGFNENYAIAAGGENVFAAAKKGDGTGFTWISAATGTKPKVKHVVTKSWPTAQVASAAFVASSYGSVAEQVPRRVEVRQAKTNKLVKTLNEGPAQAYFGFSLAITDNILWISSPRSGKVDGYDVSNFTQVASITSPGPVNGGIFGYSLAAHGPYLVVGEPSNTAPGAAWIFSANGQTLVKRLASGLTSGTDGFGCQVATRGGRTMVGSGFTDGQVSDYYYTDPGGHRPVVLWNSPTADPVRLLSSFTASSAHDSGYAIALLDDCAVIAANSETTGGVEYFASPQPAAPAGANAIAGITAAGIITPVWPAEGAPEPRWSFTKSATAGVEATVDLGGVPANPGDVVIEWSADLVEWVELADASGTALSSTISATAVKVADGTVTLSVPASSNGPGFFRLRSKD